MKFKVKKQERGQITTLYTIKRVLEDTETDIGYIAINNPAVGDFIEELKKTDIKITSN